MKPGDAQPDASQETTARARGRCKVQPESCVHLFMRHDRRATKALVVTSRMLGGSANSADMARDVVQETWIGAIRGLSGLRDPAQFPAWIYGIATRKCADVIRSSVRRRRLDAHSQTVDVIPGADVERQIDMAAGIGQLPPKQRATVHLFYGEDLTVDEIASALGVPAGTVKSRLHQARQALKRHLGERS